MNQFDSESDGISLFDTKSNNDTLFKNVNIRIPWEL